MKPCPICKKSSTQEFKPFCSKRCAEVDLGQWLTGGYALPDNPEVDEDSENGLPSNSNP